MTDYPICKVTISSTPPNMEKPLKPYVTAHSKEAADRVVRALNQLEKSTNKLVDEK